MSTAALDVGERALKPRPSPPARRSITTAPGAALVSRLNQANVSQIEEGSPCSQTGQVCAENGREGAASWAWRRTTFKVPTPRSGKAAEGEDGGNGGDRVKGAGEHESGRARPRSAVGRLMSKFVQTFTSRDSRLQQTRIQSGRAGEGWRWLQEARARSAADSTWLQRCIAQGVSREWEDRWHAQQEMAAMLLLLLLSLQGFFPAKSAG